MIIPVNELNAHVWFEHIFIVCMIQQLVYCICIYMYMYNTQLGLNTTFNNLRGSHTCMYMYKHNLDFLVTHMA
jgi:hypothetical protein